jgi:hypothetical protein
MDVRVFDKRDDSFYNRGTIAGVSPEGYVRVTWDHENVSGFPTTYSKLAAERHLRYVVGDDALPRHKWPALDVRAPDITLDVTCEVCSCLLDDDNLLGSCLGKPTSP